jgi:hypothetical protein
MTNLKTVKIKLANIDADMDEMEYEIRDRI